MSRRGGHRRKVKASVRDAVSACIGWRAEAGWIAHKAVLQPYHRALIATARWRAAHAFHDACEAYRDGEAELDAMLASMERMTRAAIAECYPEDSTLLRQRFARLSDSERALCLRSAIREGDLPTLVAIVTEPPMVSGLTDKQAQAAHKAFLRAATDGEIDRAQRLADTLDWAQENFEVMVEEVPGGA